MPEINPQQGTLSRKNNFHGAWPVFEDYIIEDGIMKETGEIVRYYYPAGDVSLPSELARLQNEGTDPLDFVRMYGTMGHKALAGPGKGRGGDPVDWLMAHANTVSILLELLGILSTTDDYAAKEVLPSLLGGLTKSGRLDGPRVGQGAHVRTRSTFLTDPEEDVMTTVHRLIRGLINPNIQGIHRELVPSPKGSQSFFTYQAPIQVVYWLLADQITGQHIQQCKDEKCNRYFISYDKRQRFCPKPPGRDESPCAVRARVRDWRRQ